MKYVCIFATVFLSGLTGAMGEDASSQDGDLVYVIRADKIYGTGSDRVSEGIVVVCNGSIKAVGSSLTAPEGAIMLACKGGGFITPGLIDAASTAGVVSERSWAEHTSEMIPKLHNLDAVDLDNPAFVRLAQEGVTAVYLTPDPASVIGSQGAVVKTDGPATSRIVRNGVDIKATLGPETWRRGQRNREPYGARSVDYHTRRPVTRMGMSWVFRKAFFDAQAYRDALEQEEVNRPDPDPDLEILIHVLEGKVPLRIKACSDIDIWSSIRLCKEFGLQFVLEQGIEAHRCIPELKAYNVPVIFGPVTNNPRHLMEGRNQQLRPCLNTAGRLQAEGITLALTAAGLAGEDALPYQACYAIRNGLPFEAALNATTCVPASILGVDSRLGALKSGLDADLVLWTARPFTPTAKPALVMIQGVIVYKDDRWILDE